MFRMRVLCAVGVCGGGGDDEDDFHFQIVMMKDGLFSLEIQVNPCALIRTIPTWQLMD